MLLISIQPFAFKRIFFLVAALLCLSSAICFADPLFMASRSTPYGRQLNRIESLSVPKRAVRRVFDQSLDGKFTEQSGWILSEEVPLEIDLGIPLRKYAGARNIVRIVLRST